MRFTDEAHPTIPGLVRPKPCACYCKPDNPDRCRWDAAARRWIGPCT